uniref:Transmembrane protein n=1 Tax=Cucumis melo TaxID=3656 RepID=A0A9I9CZN8_CUCME
MAMNSPSETEREKIRRQMGWLIRERRGPAWKQGWAEQALSSITPPPRPLLAILGILVILLSVSSYSSYRSQNKARTGLRHGRCCFSFALGCGGFAGGVVGLVILSALLSL